MGCIHSNKGDDAYITPDDNRPIKVDSVTFYRSDEDGNANEQVDGVFYTTGLRIFLNFSFFM
jgi:hypothetical protein